MVENIVSAKRPQENPEPNGNENRERSAIQFPYGDLDDAVNVAQTLHQEGGGSADMDQLAAWLGHKATNSGTFLMKLSTARMFGLVETERKRASLTRLGAEVVNPPHEKQARVTAFLNVPLYNAIYDKYRGHQLPPSVGLERAMQDLGVSSKQTGRARQAFQRSAQQAGFFLHGSDKLIIPITSKDEQRQPPAPEVDKRSGAISTGNGGGGGNPPTSHPFIDGLFQSLPLPGSRWPRKKQERWLDTARNIFGIIYPFDEDDSEDA